ncbi:hypothetical protein G4X40_02005 [Rhodococcus sp. D2-41]|nr:hypothetical protein [Rhodococcus sp. D2-41]
MRRQIAAPATDPRQVLPAPPALAQVLPYGGLKRGSVTSLSGAGSLLLGLLASVTADGGHAAVIGHPGIGLLAAVEMGVELRRLALIPDPGQDPVEIAAVLLDGMDLVVLGLGGTVVPPSRGRAVVARARSKGAALVVTGGRWDGVDVRVDSEICGYSGLGAGHGRLRALSLSVRAHGRSFQPRSARMDLRHDRGRLCWIPCPDRADPGAPLRAVEAR